MSARNYEFGFLSKYALLHIYDVMIYDVKRTTKIEGMGPFKF